MSIILLSWEPMNCVRCCKWILHQRTTKKKPQQHQYVFILSWFNQRFSFPKVTYILNSAMVFTLSSLPVTEEHLESVWLTRLLIRLCYVDAYLNFLEILRKVTKYTDCSRTCKSCCTLRTYISMSMLIEADWNKKDIYKITFHNRHLQC